MITIVDYGLGNIRAFLNVFRRLNIDATTAQGPAGLEGATKIILPGVGHFDHAMRRLEESGMRPTLDDLVLRQQVPVLGICVGMQILAASSDEGALPGLGWIDGRVRGFDSLPSSSTLQLPHMGWNDVQPRNGNRLFDQLESDAKFYFLHSFYFECASSDHVGATSEYGVEFSAAVNAGNIHGVQFHPEKSHHFGTRLLQNFAEL